MLVAEEDAVLVTVLALPMLTLDLQKLRVHCTFHIGACILPISVETSGPVLTCRVLVVHDNRSYTVSIPVSEEAISLGGGLLGVPVKERTALASGLVATTKKRVCWSVLIVEETHL